MTAINVTRELELCQGCILIDLYDEKLTCREILPLSVNNQDKMDASQFTMTELVDRLCKMPKQTELAMTGAALDVLMQTVDFEFIDWVIGKLQVMW